VYYHSLLSRDVVQCRLLLRLVRCSIECFHHFSYQLLTIEYHEHEIDHVIMMIFNLTCTSTHQLKQCSLSNCSLQVNDGCSLCISYVRVRSISLTHVENIRLSCAFRRVRLEQCKHRFLSLSLFFLLVRQLSSASVSTTTHTR
jgi:hypothetical protein